MLEVFDEPFDHYVPLVFYLPFFQMRHVNTLPLICTA